MTISILANIFCFPNSGYFDKTGVFQQTRMLTTAIWKCGKFKSKLLCMRKGGRTHTARWYFMQAGVVITGIVGDDYNPSSSPTVAGQARPRLCFGLPSPVQSRTQSDRARVEAHAPSLPA
jgi:hypothetical protein